MKKLDELKAEALSLMKAGGFTITEDLGLRVDESLPFMGYTSEDKEGKTIIVVAGWALETPMLMGLIIHELSHVYRIASKHPSHNFSLQDKALKNILGKRKLQTYQLEIIKNTINNIQDLYADDISFKVYIKDEQKNINEFFLGWIRDPNTTSGEKAKWINAGALLNAAFAQSNLERHHVVDYGDKVKNAIEKFLSKNDEKLVKRYNFFKDVMVHLPEKVTDKDFEKILTKYLGEFIKLT